MQATSRRPIAIRAKQWPRQLAKALVRLGISPNQVSVASTGFALIAAGSLLSSLYFNGDSRPFWFLLAGAGIQLRLLCNLLDGLMAVEEGMSTADGALYNDVPDRISDPVLFVAAGYACSSFGDLGVFVGWVAALASVEVAYIRYVGAVETGVQDFSGPMAKQHRMFLLTLSCILVAFLPAATGGLLLFYVLLFVVAGAVITFIRRLYQIRNTLQKRAS